MERLWRFVTATLRWYNGRMNRLTVPCCVLAAAAVAGAAHASIDGFKSSATAKPLSALNQAPPAGWRGFKMDNGGRELTFSPDGAGPNSLALVCRHGDMGIEIRAPIAAGSSTTGAIRLTSGGIVRVFFARQAGDGAAEGMVVARAPASDEMLQMFRKTGRIVVGRTSLFARTPGEKSAIEDFFTGCA